jgi:hypothetical protein
MYRVEEHKDKGREHVSCSSYSHNNTPLLPSSRVALPVTLRIAVALALPLLMGMAMAELILLDMQLVTAIVQDQHSNGTLGATELAAASVQSSMVHAELDGAPAGGAALSAFLQAAKAVGGDDAATTGAAGVGKVEHRPVLWTLVTMAMQWQFLNEQQRQQRAQVGADSRSTLWWMVMGPHADETTAKGATKAGATLTDAVIHTQAHARTSLLIFFRAAFVLLATAVATAQAAVPVRLWLSRFAQSVRDDRYLIGRQLHDRAAAAVQRAVGGASIPIA